MKIKNIVATIIILGCLALIGGIFVFFNISANLPKMITLEDYKPLVVSEVYSRDGKKVGEFFREKRIVLPYSQIPQLTVRAFIAAEDKSFFEHGGINFGAIFRAFIANLKAGHNVQGGSTITQQVAKSLMLTREKTIIRKVKEAILAYRMEKNLKKEDILYLYLNQIYLGHGAHGIEAAAQNYYRKHASELTLAETAMLAGLPKAPGDYSPVLKPNLAKGRQVYVLGRMREDGYITKEQEVKAIAEPVKVYFRENFEDFAPFYKETIRQILITEIGEKKILDEGIKIYTAMDYDKQLAAQKAVEKNLRDLDKRQGFRGAAKNLKNAEEIAQFLVKERDELITKSLPYRIVSPDGKDAPKPPLDLSKKPGPNKPAYVELGQIVDGVVTKVDSTLGLVTVRFAESQGLIDIDDMSWARKPDHTKHYTEDQIKDPAVALKVGDVVEVKVRGEKFFSKRLDKLYKPVKGKKVVKPDNLPVFADYLDLSLEQEPKAQGALISYDLETGDILAMVGGIGNTDYNRAWQAARQTGSSFKAIIYAAALEKGFTPASIIVDAPVVFEEGEGQETKKWKPGNFENKFSGDVLFRNAIIKSLNIPTVKILEKISLEWVSKYSRRLGIFSPLNLDYTMALGSSGVTLYEMTKAFSAFGRGGKRIKPVLITKVTDNSGKEIFVEKVSLDQKYQKELNALEVEFHPELAAQLSSSPGSTPTVAVATPSPTVKPNASPTLTADGKPVFDPKEVFNFQDPDQLISPQSAYLITHLLKGVVNEGTGWKAKALGRPSAGKTGTTNGYYDAWYVGYTPHVATGVWVGFDDEKPLGKFETGNSAALPIWVDYMNVAVDNTPGTDFPVPPGIVFVNIDNTTGKVASSRSKNVVKEAFREGTEPSDSSSEVPQSEEKNFFKEDLSD